MKTTIDIPEAELEEAMRHVGASTKREAVVTALVEFNRSQRARRLVRLLGSFDDVISAKELRRLRETS